MIRILACLSLLFFLVPVTYIQGPPPQRNDSQYINLEPIHLNREDPKQKTVGRLEFLAGWKMSSENSAFGGFSAMLAMPDNRFFLLSDAGDLAGFTLNERTNKAERPFIAPLPDGPPKKNEFAKQNWDAESIAHDPSTGQFWVGFEHQHNIWRYGRAFARKESAMAIEAMQKWPANGGAEALLRLEDGRFLIFSESARADDDSYHALIAHGDPSIAGTAIDSFSYAPPARFNITDAALIPGNKALMLHRRFTPLGGVSAILSIANLADVAPGKTLRSKPIATLKSPNRVDNMEALAVTREEENIIIWIASDDNFNSFQETLFLKFRLLVDQPNSRKKPNDAQKSEEDKEKAELKPGFSSLAEN